MGIDLRGLTRADLEVLAKDVEKALKRAAETERKDALKAARLAAQERGFDLEELLEPGAAKTSKASGKPKAPAKYRNPENPEQTWTGRGRKPQWLVDAVAEGADLSSFAV